MPLNSIFLIASLLRIILSFHLATRFLANRTENFHPLQPQPDFMLDVSILRYQQNVHAIACALQYRHCAVGSPFVTSLYRFAAL
jgi:hypothetical protein